MSTFAIPAWPVLGGGNIPTAAWVKDRIWHHTQTLTPLKSGELVMTLTVADNRELVG